MSNILTSEQGTRTFNFTDPHQIQFGRKLGKSLNLVSNLVNIFTNCVCLFVCDITSQLRIFHWHIGTSPLPRWRTLYFDLWSALMAIIDSDGSLACMPCRLWHGASVLGHLLGPVSHLLPRVCYYLFQQLTCRSVTIGKQTPISCMRGKGFTIYSARQSYLLIER